MLQKSEAFSQAEDMAVASATAAFLAKAGNEHEGLITACRRIFGVKGAKDVSSAIDGLRQTLAELDG